MKHVSLWIWVKTHQVQTDAHVLFSLVICHVAIQSLPSYHVPIVFAWQRQGGSLANRVHSPEIWYPITVESPQQLLVTLLRNMDYGTKFQVDSITENAEVAQERNKKVQVNIGWCLSRFRPGAPTTSSLCVRKLAHLPVTCREFMQLLTRIIPWMFNNRE